MAVLGSTAMTVSRLQPYATTVFAEMSALAARVGAVNLGQGFPDVDGPPGIARAAADAVLAGKGNQYPPGPGIPELRLAVAAHQKRFYGVDVDPDREVLVTAGATEAIAAALIALLEPGDEAIAFEPYANVPAEVRDAVEQGRKIKAIKLYRQFSGVGLREAKAFVEEVQRRAGK